MFTAKAIITAVTLTSKCDKSNLTFKKIIMMIILLKRERGAQREGEKKKKEGGETRAQRAEY